MFISIAKAPTTTARTDSAYNSAYKDQDSDSYRTTRRALNGLGALFPGLSPIGRVEGAGAPGGSTAPAGSGCAPCPTGCRTETKNEVYYARPTRQSASDVAVKVARKIVKCTDVNGTPKIACDQSGVSGLHGLSGCSSCYSGRM